MKAEGEKIAMLTAYESSFCRADGQCRRRCIAGRRFSGHGGTRSSVHFAGELAGYVLPRLNAPRHSNRHDCQRLPFGAYQQSKEQACGGGGRIDGGRRAYGQTRRRRLDGGDH